jgi:hypothetical protein
VARELPHGQAAIELEADELEVAARREHRRHEAEVGVRAIGEAHALGERGQHHHAAGGVRQRGDEQAVIATRGDAVDAPGRVAAEAVRDEPLALRAITGLCCFFAHC